MNAHASDIRPASGAATVATLVALAGLLGAGFMGSGCGEAQAASPIASPATAPPSAGPPAPRPILPGQLAIPCWSCPEAEAWPLRFRADLDLLAPLGTGGRNAGEWFAGFTQPDGARASDARAILERCAEHPAIGRILPADDPFLAEAEPWLDQAAMRLHPDVYAVEGFRTTVPNLMLALTLARSLLARGQGAARFDDAMADLRRVVRLGRLLRQDDVVVMSDLVGLAVIRMGAEGIYDRARGDGRLELALAAAVIAGEAPPQKLLSAARMTDADVLPYLARGAGGSSIALPGSRFEGLRKLALDGRERRFRLEASASLALLARFGSGNQRAGARQILEALASSDDPVIAGNARWHLANPPDERRLDQLLAQKG